MTVAQLGRGKNRDSRLLVMCDLTYRGEPLFKTLYQRIKAACFSGCCWGEMIADECVDAAFRVACAPNPVDANGAYGIPMVLHVRKNGKSVATSDREAKNDVIMPVSDNSARQLHPRFPGANSYETIKGTRATRITLKSLGC